MTTRRALQKTPPKSRFGTLTLTTLEDRCNPVTIGSLDPTFGMAGISTPLPNGTTFVDTVQIANGNFLAVGTDAAANFVVAQFHSDGSLDTSFGVNGVVTGKFQGAFSSGQGIAVDTDDGSIYIVGFANGSFGRAKLNSSGTILTAINSGFGNGYNGVTVNSATNEVYAVGNLGTNFIVQRYNANLVPINFLTVNFGAPGVVDRGISVTLAPDGRVFASVRVDNTSDFGLFRSEANLTNAAIRVYDLGGVTEAAVGVKVSPTTGDVFLSGFTNAAGNRDVAVVKVNPNDLNTFSTGILNRTADQNGFRLDLDNFNRPVVAGGDPTNGAFVARFTSNLASDTSFAPNGFVSLGLPAASQMTGSLLIPPPGKSRRSVPMGQKPRQSGSSAAPVCQTA